MGAKVTNSTSDTGSDIHNIDFVCKSCFSCYRCYMKEYAPDEFKICSHRTVRIAVSELSPNYKDADSCAEIPKAGKGVCRCWCFEA